MSKYNILGSYFTGEDVVSYDYSNQVIKVKDPYKDIYYLFKLHPIDLQHIKKLQSWGRIIKIYPESPETLKDAQIAEDTSIGTFEPKMFVRLDHDKLIDEPYTDNIHNITKNGVSQDPDIILSSNTPTQERKDRGESTKNSSPNISLGESVNISAGSTTLTAAPQGVGLSGDTVTTTAMMIDTADGMMKHSIINEFAISMIKSAGFTPPKQIPNFTRLATIGILAKNIISMAREIQPLIKKL